MGKLYQLFSWAAVIFILFTNVAFAQVIDFEDFGTGPYPGPELPAGQTTYIFNAPNQPALFPNILDDGEYVLATDSQQGFVNWSSIGDNTTGTGYMLLVNADENQSGEFYRRRVTLTANTTFDFLAYLVTVNSQEDFDFCTTNEGGLVLPNVTFQVEDVSGTVLGTFDTGDIPYPLFALTGMAAWNFFTFQVIHGAMALIEFQSIITKVYFPKIIIHLSKTIVALIDFFILLGFCFLLMIYYGCSFSLQLFLLPLFLIIGIYCALQGWILHVEV